MDGAGAGLGAGPPSLAAKAASPPSSAPAATLATTATPVRPLQRRSAAWAASADPAVSRSACSSSSVSGDAVDGSADGVDGSADGGPSSAPRRPSTPPVRARHAAQSSTGGRAGFARANLTVGVESSGEAGRVGGGGFAVFWSDVRLTRPGDQDPLDVPDDHGIRQRRRPNTVPRTLPRPARSAGLSRSPHSFCHCGAPANQRLISSRAIQRMGPVFTRPRRRPGVAWPGG